MSIWSPWTAIGWDQDATDPDRPAGGEVRASLDGRANHYPTTDTTTDAKAMVQIASIQPWCVPGHEQTDLEPTQACGPWLRLSVASPDALTWWPNSDGERPTPRPIEGDVVMSQTAVSALVAQLVQWLELAKVHPRKDAT